MYIVILAGGSGTRFWPLSRKKTPKQLMSILGGKSMLQRTVERVLPLQPKRILVVTNRDQAAETVRQLADYRQVPLDILELFRGVEGVGNDLRFFGAVGSPALRVTSLDVSGE